jgi:hypothetical protein
VIALPAAEFIARFLLHVLPKGFKRIRHYGLLGPAKKRVGLAAARVALCVPPLQPAVIESAEAFLRRVARIEWRCCPYCRAGRLVSVEVIQAVPIRSPAPRGPP